MRRLARGALLTYTITTSAPINADQWVHESGGFALSHDYHGGDAYWASLEDASHTRYPVVSGSNNRCVCTFDLDSQITDADSEIDPGATSPAWSVVSAPPAGTDTVDVHFNHYQTVHDVPISK